MKTRLFLCTCLTAVLCATLATTSEARLWTSSTGSTLEGEFVKTDGKDVTIRRSADDVEMTFPLGKLSQADRDFVTAIPAGGMPAKTADKEGVDDDGKALLAEGWTEGVFGKYKVPYLLFEGASLDPSKKYPLVLYLHGQDGVGMDNRSQLNDGVVETFINDAQYAKHPCVVLVPQLRPRKHWTSAIGTDVMGLARSLVADHPIDEKKLYICGHSIGAVGAWELVQREGSQGGFVAALVVSGGYADPQRLWHRQEVPSWAFHGDADTFLAIEDMRILVDALKKRGGDVRFTEYPGEGNDIALKVFSTPELHDWMFQQSR